MSRNRLHRGIRAARKACRWFWFSLLCSCTGLATGTSRDSRLGRLSELVDTRIGSDESPTFNPATSVHGGSGNVFVGAAVPFGMVQFGPDTDHPGRLDYRYADTAIRGFSLTHLSGAGCIKSHELPAYPLFQPFSGATSVPYSHRDERARAGSYRVRLENGVEAELTATERTGWARFEFPSSSSPVSLSITTPTGEGPGGEFHQLSPTRFSGWAEEGNFCDRGNRFKVYYAVEFESPASNVETLPRSVVIEFPRQEGAVRMRAGISYISEDGAWLNLSRESRDWDFDAVRTRAKAEWDRELGRIEVARDSASSGDRKIFYTALYHSLLHPNLYSDANGEYLGFDGKVHALRPGQDEQYANYSGWDIYRTQMPLVALLEPERAGDMMSSLLNDAEQCGAIPKWPYNNSDTAEMSGDPGAILMGETHALGARNFDPSEALRFVLKSADDPSSACGSRRTRPGLSEYLRYGYVPIGTPGVDAPASATLEYASADYAASRLARSLGRTRDAERLLARSNSWQELLDPTTGMMRPKDADGQWLTPFDPSHGQGFMEGNAVQYTWFVPFDFPELVQESGGPAPVEKALDRMFEKLNEGENAPYFWMGNEPGFAAPWVYTAAGLPWKTQEILHRLMRVEFTALPGGLPGNDDLGAMSAWYVWAALGLYPVVPGGGSFYVSAPAFDDITVRLGDGADLHIASDKSSDDMIYVQSAELDGRPLSRYWIRWQDIAQGAGLGFRLGASPGSAFAPEKAR